MIGPSAEEIADAIKSGCDSVESHVRSAVAAAPGRIDDLLDLVRVGWPVSVPLPEEVKRLIRALILEAVRECADLIYDALDEFRLLARSVGRPSLLRQAARRLDEDVITPSVALDKDMVTSELKAQSRGSWDSLATDAYTTAFTEQKSAVGSVDEVARGLRIALEDLAGDIEEFFDELQFAYVSFAISAAGLALAIVTAVETLGVGAVIGLAVAIAGAVVGIGGLIVAFTGAADHNADTAERLTEMPALSWPQSVFAS